MGLLDWLKDGKRQPGEGVPVDCSCSLWELNWWKRKCHPQKEKVSSSKDAIGVAGEMAQSLRVCFPASAQWLVDVYNSSSGRVLTPFPRVCVDHICGGKTPPPSHAKYTEKELSLWREVGNNPEDGHMEGMHKREYWAGKTYDCVCVCPFRRVYMLLKVFPLVF